MSKRGTGSIDKHIGQRIRLRRHVLSMSQTALADALGLTFQQVQKYEKGKNRVSISTMCEIATALKVPVAFFLEGIADTSKAPAGSDPIAEFASNHRGFQLARAFMAIESAAARDAVLAVAEALAKQSESKLRKVA